MSVVVAPAPSPLHEPDADGGGLAAPTDRVDDHDRGATGEGADGQGLTAFSAGRMVPLRARHCSAAIMSPT